jgi:hypothetical protein
MTRRRRFDALALVATNTQPLRLLQLANLQRAEAHDVAVIL